MGMDSSADGSVLGSVDSGAVLADGALELGAVLSSVPLSDVLHAMSDTAINKTSRIAITFFILLLLSNI
jgi:hypothetical protein